jgi:hypothetical protein
MDINLAYCGLSCELCPIRWKTLENDSVKVGKLIKQIIKTGKEQYNLEIKPEEITDCDGCNVKNGRIFSKCNNCLIRKCAIEKKVKNCAYCNEYPCKKLEDFHTKVPESKDRLDTINAVYR